MVERALHLLKGNFEKLIQYLKKRDGEKGSESGDSFIIRIKRQDNPGKGVTEME